MQVLLAFAKPEDRVERGQRCQSRFVGRGLWFRWHLRERRGLGQMAEGLNLAHQLQQLRIGQARCRKQPPGVREHQADRRSLVAGYRLDQARNLVSRLPPPGEGLQHIWILLR